MKVRWTSAAREDRRGIIDYISKDNRSAARRMNGLFRDAAQRLIEHPRLGKPSEIPGTRELLAHRSYRLVYAIGSDTIWVLALVHTSRQWPPQLP